MAISTKATLRIEGLDDLRRRLRHYPPELRKELRKMNKAAATLVVPAAQAWARHESGAMAASVKAAADQRAGYVQAGRSGLPYVGVQHFGWPAHGIEPNPFLYEALDERQGAVLDAYERAVAILTIKMF